MLRSGLSYGFFLEFVNAIMVLLKPVRGYFMSQKKGKKRNHKQEEKEEKRSRFDLDPDVTKGIWGVFFVVLGIFIVLSFLGKGGVIGAAVLKILDWVFGIGAYGIPAVLAGLTLIFFTSWRRNVYLSSFIGTVAFLASTLGLIALTDSAHMRGGMLGFLSTWPLLRLVGVWGTVLILAGLFMSSIFISFNISPKRLWKREEKEERDGELAEGEVRVKSFVESDETSSAKDVEKSKQKEPRPSDEAKAKEDKKKEEFVVWKDKRGGLSFRLPPLELLEKESGKPHSGDIVASANIIKRTLQNFGVDVEMGEVSVGPTVTQFTLKPAEGMKLSRITALHNDLALALAAHPLRIEAPIPGRAFVGIEVPNKGIATVRLHNILKDDGYQKSPNSLTLALGRDVTGAPVYANLAKMPHMLIAGSTGSGKTIALNAIILSLLYRNPPELLRLILIDPKRVEFPVYADIPHLLAPIVVESQKAINALRWAVSEMERRFDVLARAKVRDIQGYNTNKKVVSEEGYLPYIVIVIDELADIMASRGKEAEALIVRVAQMARAVGIHLVLATQRPSVEVITGLIKANITSRAAFQVASQVDSRTIIDMAGAEKLLGNGDMLYLAPESSKPRRVQGAFVSDQDTRRVADFLREEAKKMSVEDETQPDFNKIQDVSSGAQVGSHVDFDENADEWNDGDDDELYKEAQKVVIAAQRASASLLQRRLRVGYARAARLLDMLEERGVVGPGDGAKPREVYHSAEDEAADGI